MPKIFFVMNDRADSSKGYKQVSEDYIKGYIDGFTDGRPYFINLGYAVMETDEENYRSFYKEYERNKYLEKLDKANELLSYNALDNKEFQGADIVADISEPFEEVIVRKAQMECLYKACELLTHTEKKILQCCLLGNKTERELSLLIGVPRTTIEYQKNRLLKKLKKILEK